MNILDLFALLLFVSVVICWSPTDGYAPGNVSCPSKDLTRDADSLSKEEKEWLEGRGEVTDENLIKFLEGLDLDDFDAESFVNNASDPIKIGLAFSGGGYRAMLSGAGQLAALDNRTEGALKHGLGGLLQASSYLAGLSGGSWLVGTFALNNFTSIESLVNGRKVWDLDHSIVNYGGANLVKKARYYEAISDDLDDKKDAGFEVSLTDTWGRALSYQFFPTVEDYGAGLTWSTIRDSEPFKNHEMPFPIVVADGRTPGTYIISGNSTVFEFNAFEMGSWDPTLYQFTDVKYIGTETNDGKPTTNSCIAGFDNAGYVLGTSSSLFNQFVLQINTTSISSVLKDLISDLLQDLSEDENDIAVYKPNPFYKSTLGLSNITSNDTLYLVDGGEDLQNIPLYPLIQPERKLDVIFAYDNSADTDESWPNGTSLVASYERQFLSIGNGTVFPYVPDATTFRNLNLTSKPAFFGCDAKNLTSLTKKTNALASAIYDTPLIVYTANRPFTYWSNQSTFKLSYDEDEVRGMIQNGFETATRLNLTLDEDWPVCVGCAIIRREQERKGIEQSDQCKECFSNYCWDGTLDTSSNPGINFTTTGQTNGPEKTGNKTISGGNSLRMSSGDHSVSSLISYLLLLVGILAINI